MDNYEITISKNVIEALKNDLEERVGWILTHLQDSFLTEYLGDANKDEVVLSNVAQFTRLYTNSLKELALDEKSQTESILLKQLTGLNIFKFFTSYNLYEFINQLCQQVYGYIIPLDINSKTEDLDLKVFKVLVGSKFYRNSIYCLAYSRLLNYLKKQPFVPRFQENFDSAFYEEMHKIEIEIRSESFTVNVSTYPENNPKINLSPSRHNSKVNSSPKRHYSEDKNYFTECLTEEGKKLIPFLKKTHRVPEEHKGKIAMEFSIMFLALSELDLFIKNKRIVETKMHDALINMFGNFGRRSGFNENNRKLKNDVHVMARYKKIYEHEKFIINQELLKLK